MRKRMLLAVLFCAASTLLAHHGWTGYEEGKTMNVTGTIRESSYDNPHATIKLQADGDKGKTWTAILAPPSRMQARGLSSDAIKPGTKATVVGYPNKSDPNEMRIERIIINGKTVELR